MHEPHTGPVYLGAQDDSIVVAISQVASFGDPMHASGYGHRVTSEGEPGYDQKPDKEMM